MGYTVSYFTGFLCVRYENKNTTTNPIRSSTNYNSGDLRHQSLKIQNTIYIKKIYIYVCVSLIKILKFS